VGYPVPPLQRKLRVTGQYSRHFRTAWDND